MLIQGAHEGELWVPLRVMFIVMADLFKHVGKVLDTIDRENLIFLEELIQLLGNIREHLRANSENKIEDGNPGDRTSIHSSMKTIVKGLHEILVSQEPSKTALPTEEATPPK